MNHATMSLAEIERLLAETQWPPTLTQQAIAEAMARGLVFAKQVMESTRGMFGPHPDDYRLVLR